MAEEKPQRLAPKRLAGSWAKLERAQGHVNKLRRAIVEACDGKAPPRVLGTRREFDLDENLILWRAERLPEIGADWGLIIGDAIHNIRCALDHLWWQLSIDHLGRKPTDEEARVIQFPILTYLDPEKFRSHRFLKHVGTEAADKAERMQRYDAPANQSLLLTALADLSNHDKHREIRPAFFINTNIGLPIMPLSEVMVDCEIPIERRDGQQIIEPEIVYPTSNRLAAGDVVVGVRVRPTGPSPDIEVEPDVTGEIALGEGEYTFAILDEIGKFVWGALNWFAPLLRSP